MPTYTLRFSQDGLGEPKVIKFDGETPSAAFAVLDQEAPARQVEIWEGEDRLGNLVRGRSGVWHIDAS